MYIHKSSGHIGVIAESYDNDYVVFQANNGPLFTVKKNELEPHDAPEVKVVAKPHFVEEVDQSIDLDP